MIAVGGFEDEHKPTKKLHEHANCERRQVTETFQLMGVASCFYKEHAFDDPLSCKKLFCVSK